MDKFSHEDAPTGKLQSGRMAILVILAGFLLLYITPLGVRPLVIPDETRYAEIPREMIASGDWVVPRLNGLDYFEKPVLGYWLNAATIKIFGENAFAVRLPAALATGLTALIIFLLAAPFAGTDRTAILSTIIFLTSIEVFCLGVFSTLDSLLALFLTGALASFFMAWQVRKKQKRFYLYLAMSGISCGLACLTKGFLGLAVPLMVIVPFLVWQKDWQIAVKTTIVLTGLTILVMLPWGLAIHMKAPDFWRFFIWNEHIQRFLSDDAQHKQSFFYFFLVLPLGLFPWAVLLPATLNGFIKEKTDTPFLRFTLCWLVIPFLFFSVSSGKLATYVLPCFPPLAILTAVGLEKFFRSGRIPLFNGGIEVLVGLTVLSKVLFLALQNDVFENSVFPIEFGQAFLLIAGLVPFTILLICSFKAVQPENKLYLFAAAPLLFFFSTHFLMPESVARGKAPGPFLEKYASTISKDSPIVATNSMIRAVCWFFKRDNVFLLYGGGELSYGLKHSDGAHRNLTFKQFKRLIMENRRHRPVVLVIDDNRYRRWQAELPVPNHTDTNGDGGFIVAVYD